MKESKVSPVSLYARKENNMVIKRKYFHGLLMPAMIMAFHALVIGCGGNGPIEDTPAPPNGGTGSITFSLTKLSDNSPTTSVSVDSPAKLTATAEDSSGRRIVLKIMSFSTTSDLLFDPASGTALTNANGTASIIVKAGKTTGATTIKAEITDYSGTVVTGTISLSVTGTGTVTGSITFSLTKLSDNSVTTSVSVDSPAKLTATAKDSSGRPIAFQVISFSTTSDLSFDPASGTALTDANGSASITVKAGNTSGATTIRALITDILGTAVSGTVSLSIATPNLSLSALTINPATLSAGGSAGVSVTVMDGSGNPLTTTVAVSFTSDGVKIGKATITSQVYTVNGVASATYRDINFGALDTITATLSIGGTTTLTKTGTITVNAAAAGAISFVSATPANIALKGTGGAGRSETSVVVFKVLDTNGNTIKKKVNFSLVANTIVGGLSLSNYSADSDPLTGLVQTIVNAGTASTPVRVSATIDGTMITTTSDNLVVSTGIPAQNSFSPTASILNIEGWSFDGITSDITVRLADHYNNPVPDGTAVYFRTSGGSIQPSCTTTKGACTVQFTSQAPRPANGRAVVWAYALGEESFLDLNGNGQYDPGIDTFTDLPEPFLDANENGVRDIDEEFIDTNSDGLYSPGDGIFNGILRNSSLSGPTTIHVRGSLAIVLSGSDAVIKIDGSTSPPARNIPPCTTAAPFTPGSVSFNVVVADVNGNAMPEGTTISFSTTNGQIMTTPTTYEVPSTSARSLATYPVTIQSDATQSSRFGTGTSTSPYYYLCYNTKPSGIFTVTVTTPKGVASYQYVTVID
jgi:hypothetical protein